MFLYRNAIGFGDGNESKHELRGHRIGTARLDTYGILQFRYYQTRSVFGFKGSKLHYYVLLSMRASFNFTFFTIVFFKFFNIGS